MNDMKSDFLPVYKENRSVAERVRSLLDGAAGIYEREDACRMALLALVSGEGVFLYGPPGTAKSMVAKWAAGMLGADGYFSCLLNQYTQPDELFGPVSVKLLEEGEYRRLTKGYMPEAKVAFLDEIWKAGPAILNTLLTITNEKTFRNGSEVLQVPLELLLSASNEFPEEESGLFALYDRFLFRMEVNPVREQESFSRLILGGNQEESPHVRPIPEVELAAWREGIKSVTISDEILGFLYELRLELEEMEVYVSDRRWKKVAGAMRACAFLNGRSETNLSDLCLLPHCLWSRLEEQEKINDALNSVFAKRNWNEIEHMKGIVESIEKMPETKVAECEEKIKSLEEAESSFFKTEEKLKEKCLSDIGENIFMSESFPKNATKSSWIAEITKIIEEVKKTELCNIKLLSLSIEELLEDERFGCSAANARLDDYEAALGRIFVAFVNKRFGVDLTADNLTAEQIEFANTKLYSTFYELFKRRCQPILINRFCYRGTSGIMRAKEIVQFLDLELSKFSPEKLKARFGR